MKSLRWFCGVLLLPTVLSVSFATPARGQAVPAARTDELAEILDGFRAQPLITTELQYIMTARVRLLIFWTGKDDVGFARIRRGTSAGNPQAMWIDLLAGSDPEKAPRAINRWGSAAESFVRTGRGVDASTFFGFMKISQGSSTAEMQEELAREKENREFLFSAILDHSGQGGEFVKILPFTSDKDFTIKDVDRATPSVLDRLAGSQGRVKTVDATRRRACERSAGFLSTVAELIADALANPESEAFALLSVQRRTAHFDTDQSGARRGADDCACAGEGAEAVFTHLSRPAARRDGERRTKRPARLPASACYWPPRESCGDCPSRFSISRTGGSRWC